ncbi:MAG: hypothetical protein ACOX6T_21930 [Myxococcales bacterium]
MAKYPDERARSERPDPLLREREFYEKVEREQDLDEEEAERLLEERAEFPRGERR